MSSSLSLSSSSLHYGEKYSKASNTQKQNKAAKDLAKLWTSILEKNNNAHQVEGYVSTNFGDPTTSASRSRKRNVSETYEFDHDHANSRDDEDLEDANEADDYDHDDDHDDVDGDGLLDDGEAFSGSNMDVDCDSADDDGEEDCSDYESWVTCDDDELESLVDGEDDTVEDPDGLIQVVDDEEEDVDHDGDENVDGKNIGSITTPYSTVRTVSALDATDLMEQGFYYNPEDPTDINPEHLLRSASLEFSFYETTANDGKGGGASYPERGESERDLGSNYQQATTNNTFATTTTTTSSVGATNASSTNTTELQYANEPTTLSAHELFRRKYKIKHSFMIAKVREQIESFKCKLQLQDSGRTADSDVDIKTQRSLSKLNQIFVKHNLNKKKRR
jgi:hypothetical protein